VKAVARLVTRVDLDADAGDGRRLAFGARLEAVLVDGRRLPLLEGRGWTTELAGAAPATAPIVTAEEIGATARVVVGPDEPPPGRSHEDVERAHWEHLADALRRQGVAADAHELSALRHDVELGARLQARLDRDAGA
jgi:hypothetical protein